MQYQISKISLEHAAGLVPGVEVPVRAPVDAQRGSEPNHPKAARFRTQDLPALTSAEVALIPILRFLGSCNAVALPVSRSPCFFPSLAFCIKCSDCSQGFCGRFVNPIFHFCHPPPFHLSNFTIRDIKFPNNPMAPHIKLRPFSVRGFRTQRGKVVSLAPD